MRIATYLRTVATILLLSAFTAQSKTPTLYNKVNKKGMNDWVEFTMQALTPRERIAQLMMPVIPADDTEATTNSLIQYVEKDKVGGLLIAKGNILAHAKITNLAQEKSSTPLLISLDGEWGLQMRMPDALPFPKNMILGAITEDKLLYEYGLEVARQCRRLGIHVNFAPTLDVNTNPKNPVIGYRSFGDSPEIVARLGIAYSRGLEDGGVLSVAKHFPGHGGTSEDSHKTLPVISDNFIEYQLTHVYPFTQYIKAGLGAILVGHLNILSIESGNIPTSLSKKIVTNLLKEKLGFKGLVFTDALSMKGVNNGENNCLEALMAGNDVLLCPKNVTQEINSIEDAIKRGVISQNMVDERCRNILEYKYILGLNYPQYIEEKNVTQEINTTKAELLLRKLWNAAITAIKNPNEILPITNLANNKIALLSLGGGANSNFKNTSALYSEIATYVDDISTQQIKDYNTIIVGIHNDSEASKQQLEKLVASGKNIIATFFISPYKLIGFKESINAPNVATILAYENNNLAQEYAAQAIFGGIDVSGRLPVTLEGIAKRGTSVKYDACRLGYTLPEEVGIDSRFIAFVDSIANVGVSSGAFPGCQVLVARKGKVICNKSYGFLDQNKKDSVSVNSIYDLASVSKATGTLSGIMKAYDNNLIRIDDKASKYIKELRGTPKSQITIRELLFHETGIPATINVYDAMLDSTTFTKPLFQNKKDKTYNIYSSGGSYGNKYAKMRTDIVSHNKSEKFQMKICDGLYGNTATTDTLMARIYNSKLKPNKNYLYSCLNFCILKQIEENVTNTPHNEYVEKEIFSRLGANNTLYCPLDKFDKKQIAMTEYDAMLRKQTIRGYVHDELAAFSGGVQGNAGLFANANDIAKLCQMWLNRGEYGGERILSKNTVNLFIKTKSQNSRRGLGFDKPDKTDNDKSPTCSEATAETFGHLGFTGTCFWVDPQNELIYIFLCNRVCPTRDNKAFNELDIRPRIFSALYSLMQPKSDKMSIYSS